MSDAESLEGLDYLQTGFDPASLTVPRLRSILITYNISYPASAKKPQLIQIFNDKVVPQARKILATRARAKRTSKGIEDADSQESITTSQADEELEPSPPPPRRATRSSSPRKISTRLASEEIQHEELSGRTPRRVSARSGSKHTRTSDTDDADEQLQRSMRRATIAPRRAASPRKVTPATPAEPQVKYEDDEGSRMRNSDVFSHDNPFQSGSSPPSGRRSISGSRRKTVGIPDVKETIRKKINDPSRRRTDVPQSAADRDIHPPSAIKFQISSNQMDGLRDVDDNGVEASEEFTPEAQQELVQERSQKGRKALGPLRPKKKSSGLNLAGPMWVILMTVLAGYAAWYRKEKFAVGYCGIGRPANPIISSKVDLPEWVTILAEPQCEVCPAHAYCSSDLDTTCDTDFVLKSHPLSLGNFLPFPPTCEPDGEKVKKVQAVANRAVEELRDRRAKYECGELGGEAGAAEPTPEVDVEELKQQVAKKRRKAMSDDEFEDLWSGAIPEIKARDEVESKVDRVIDASTVTEIEKPSLATRSPWSPPPVPSDEASESRWQNIMHIIIANRTAEARVPELVALTLDRLATQASLHAQDEITFPEGWISIGQLRDDVLREEHSIVKREKLWSKVRKVVEMNANVRAVQRESRNGEISRVWEWIGNIVPVSLPEGSSRKKGGRVSFGTYGDSATPVSGDDGGSKWEESRPIY